MKDEIHVSGEKEGVARVMEIFNKDHNEYVRFEIENMDGLSRSSFLWIYTFVLFCP